MCTACSSSGRSSSSSEIGCVNSCSRHVRIGGDSVGHLGTDQCEDSVKERNESEEIEVEGWG